MQKYIVILFNLFLLFLFACEKEVQIDIDPIDTRLVVLSNFSNGSNILGEDSLFRVTISHTRDALSNGDTLPLVADAVVDLYEGENNFIERLSLYQPTQAEDNKGINPYYRTSSYKPQLGRSYTLRVAAPNIREIRAKGSIPQEQIDYDASIIIEKEVYTGNGYKSVDYTIDLSLQDLPDVENYYHVNLFQVINSFRVNELTGDTMRTPFIYGPLTFDIKDNNQEVLPYIENKGVLIEDSNFDGINKLFSFKGNFRYNPNSQEPNDFIIEVRNASRDYYLYHSSLTRQVRVGEGFDAISGAVVLYNNIEDGFGNFAGYSSSVKNFQLLD